jgi:hypothetical protein
LFNSTNVPFNYLLSQRLYDKKDKSKQIGMVFCSELYWLSHERKVDQMQTFAMAAVFVLCNEYSYRPMLTKVTLMADPLLFNTGMVWVCN